MDYYMSPEQFLEEEYDEDIRKNPYELVVEMGEYDGSKLYLSRVGMQTFKQTKNVFQFVVTDDYANHYLIEYVMDKDNIEMMPNCLPRGMTGSPYVVTPI